MIVVITMYVPQRRIYQSTQLENIAVIRHVVVCTWCHNFECDLRFMLNLVILQGPLQSSELLLPIPNFLPVRLNARFFMYSSFETSDGAPKISTSSSEDILLRIQREK